MMQLTVTDTYVLCLLCTFIRGHYPTANDFGSEVIPMAAKDFDVQVFTLHNPPKSKMNLWYPLLLLSCHEHVILKDMFFCWLQAYLFDGYWEDIGTIKSFFEANLALTDQVYISIDIVSSLIFLCQDNNFIYYVVVSQLLFL